MPMYGCMPVYGRVWGLAGQVLGGRMSLACGGAGVPGSPRWALSESGSSRRFLFQKADPILHIHTGYPVLLPDQQILNLHHTFRSILYLTHRIAVASN